MYDRAAPRKPAGSVLPAAVADHLDAIAAWEDAVLAQLSTDQLAIGWGDCWVGLAADTDAFLFGRVATVAECAQRELACGADRDEVLDADRALRAAFARGYRLGMVYGVERPDGEFVSTHLANMLHRVTAEEFAVARDHAWNVAAMREAGAVCLDPNGRGLLIGPGA